MSKPVGVHWATHAEEEARNLGFGWMFLSATDVIDPAKRAEIDAFARSGLECVLVTSWHTEGMLFNTNGEWESYIHAVYDGLKVRNLLSRVLALQFDDEFYSRIASNAGNPHVFHPTSWPLLSHIRPTPYLLPEAARLLNTRAREVQRIFGPDFPSQGIGLAEPGGVDPPNFPLQKWWGCNFYLGRPGWYIPDAAEVQALYEGAARKGLLLMPVLPIFGDHGQPPPSVAELAACYLPILQTHDPRIWAVGVFCLNHPSSWAPSLHGEGRGILQLPPQYSEATRWLTRFYA